MPHLCIHMKNDKYKRMKYSLLTLLIGVSVYYANAQSFEIGLRYMPTVSSLEISTPGEGRVVGDFSGGYGIGGFFGIKVTNYLGFQAEVIYNSFSQKYREENVERDIKLKYINIPLLLSLNTGKSNAVNFNIVGGPQIGISVGSDIFSNGTTAKEPVLLVKKGDLGLAYGAGIDFGINASKSIRLGLGFRGVLGMIDISDDSRTITTDSYYVLDRSHITTYSAYAGLSIIL